MPRVRYVDPKRIMTHDCDALAEFLGPPKPAKKKRSSVRGISDADFAKLLEEVASMLARGEWASAAGRHFVALYAELHFKVYGVVDESLGAKERVYATKMANDMLAGDFANDPKKMAPFVAWTWSREKGREQWRRENRVGGGHIGWRFQFSRKLLTEYRLEEARKAGRR